MAYVRKYKPKGYKDGGAVVPDAERVDAPVPEETTPTESPNFGDLADQIEAMHETDPWRYQVASWTRHQALAEGVPDDTPEMRERIEQGYRETTAQQHRIGQETAKAYAMSMQAHVAQREPSSPPMEHAIATAAALTLPMPEAPQKARSLPMSAPVSRETRGLDGRPNSGQFNPATGHGKITLTPEERDIARRSYSAPGMTDDQKDYAYAVNKKMMLMKKHDGSLT